MWPSQHVRRRVVYCLVVLDYDLAGGALAEKMDISIQCVGGAYWQSYKQRAEWCLALHHLSANRGGLSCTTCRSPRTDPSALNSGCKYTGQGYEAVTLQSCSNVLLLVIVMAHESGKSPMPFATTCSKGNRGYFT